MASITVELAKKVKPSKDDGDDDEGETGEGSSYDDVEDSAADALADAAGVPDDKRDDFKSALGDYVEACFKKLSKE
jgi:hypothetical protein